MKGMSVFENENISTEMVRKICEDLQKERLEMLSFRNCSFTDKDFKKVTKAVGACTSLTLRHFALNIGIIRDSFRVQSLAQTIERNASLVGLHLHGNNIPDADFKTLYHHLKRHPRIMTLDLGDCNLGDEGIELICSLIKESKDIHGLHHLVLSHNPGISSDGWTKLGMALASGSCLRSLEIDYNDIGDSVATCIAIALPGATHLEMLDLECTGITDKTGQVFLHLMKSYNLKLRDINLERTQVLESTKEAIKSHILYTDKKTKHTSDDECSLTMSEPPLSDARDPGLCLEDFGHHSKSFIDPSGNITRTESFDTGGLPIVEVSPVNQQDTYKTNEKEIEEITANGGTQSMTNFENDKNTINAAGFEIKKAFSMNDLTYFNSDRQTKGEGEENKMNDFEEYEAYIPERESFKHKDSASTLVESIEQIDDIENDVDLQSDSTYSVKGFQETDDTSKSGNPSHLFYSRPMSAPMSGNDRPDVESGLLQAKLNDTALNAAPKDLASIIREKKVKSNSSEEITSRSRTNDLEIQELN
ncbi:uncharacterized protein LOC123528049 [Mercenaria mercenaria]|uniref:uncharacterized protein LOC123528049 n=1 Tax=Mercenaria mercenaria TaxID=6596 RepID=UPI00234F8972|nr:uncharacterized protein LOC123528049 [Mercenaria mercenaria]